MAIRTPHAHDPQDATTPVDGMDITEMLRDRAYTSLKLCEEAADEIEWLRGRVKELEGRRDEM